MKKTFETFRNIGSYEIFNLTKKEPDCFNGRVEVVKYRITIEKIKEPSGLIGARIQKLWDECDNPHHWQPLRRTAKINGYAIKE